ncbi:MAG: hypothetical protein PUE13_08990 [Clostridiales bacterium]|nr:hypothetical protein [Clostridiales bacterium]
MKRETGKYYEGSTQEWLPIRDIKNGTVLLKDGRYVKIVEVLPVNFYLKSEVEQENIIFYFASYLKIAPDKIQIRAVTQRADIDAYLKNLNGRLDMEQNELCKNMIADEAAFVKGLSDNTAVKKRFFMVFEYAPAAFSGKYDFSDVVRALSDEVYKAQKYLMQCGLEVIDCDNGMLIDLFHQLINKKSSRYIPPGSITEEMLGAVHERKE